MNNNFLEIEDMLRNEFKIGLKAVTMKVFVHHLDAFTKRYQNNESVDFILSDAIRSQVNQEQWNLALKIGEATLKKLTVKKDKNIDEKETFLIATHLINAEI